MVQEPRDLLDRLDVTLGLVAGEQRTIGGAVHVGPTQGPAERGPHQPAVVGQDVVDVDLEAKDLRLALEAAERSGVRMDQARATLAITSEIIDLVQTAELCVIDLTDRNASPFGSRQRAGGTYAFRSLLEPYGMNILVVSDKPGAASAMKLMRSVCMKGIAALLL